MGIFPGTVRNMTVLSFFVTVQPGLRIYCADRKKTYRLNCYHFSCHAVAFYAEAVCRAASPALQTSFPPGTIFSARHAPSRAPKNARLLSHRGSQMEKALPPPGPLFTFT